MVNGCENCIAYLIRYGKYDADPCHECGQKALIWKQNSFGTFYMQCSNCGAEVAVDLNTPCELDELMSQKVEIELKKQARFPDNNTIIKLGKCLQINAMEMRKRIADGCAFKIEYAKVTELVKILGGTDIDFVIHQNENPIKKYLMYEQCGYPYSPMRVFLEKD